MRRFCRAALVTLTLFAAFCFFNNTNLFSSSTPERPPLLAHRGHRGHLGIWTNRIDRIAPLAEALR
jgi:hypothetical protein